MPKCTLQHNSTTSNLNSSLHKPHKQCHFCVNAYVCIYIYVFFLYHISEGIYDLPDKIETGTYLGNEAYFKHY